jgi:thiamine-monophosphate kinase
MFRTLKLKPTSMIDISDGLSSELWHICKSSNVGCRIYADKIPIHRNTKTTAEEMNIESIIAALNGGEDYELLFTLPLESFDAIKTQKKITAIGHINKESEGKYLVTNTGSEIELVAQGWNAMHTNT